MRPQYNNIFLFEGKCPSSYNSLALGAVSHAVNCGTGAGNWEYGSLRAAVQQNGFALPRHKHALVSFSF